jgi:transcriptional regulator with XRE-family HTH domain
LGLQHFIVSISGGNRVKAFLPMDFQVLQIRLIAHIQARVRNGEVTERSLARLTGISQPHMHHVLKGARRLSIAMADRILERLRIDLVDLLAGEDSAPRPAPPEVTPYRLVALLEGPIGPGHPYPAQASGQEKYPFPAAELERLESPVAAHLAPNPNWAALFGDSAVVLLDRSETLRGNPDEESYYALDLGGESGIQLVRRAGQRLYMRNSGEDPRGWRSVSWAGHSLLELIKGRVSLVVRRL